MKYKLIALDLDGTLTNDEKVVTPRTREALMEAQRRGVTVVLASGRPTQGIVPVAEALDIEHYGGYIMAFNGGRITDWSTKEIVSDSVVDPSLMPYLYQCSKDSGFPILTYQGDSIVTEEPDDEYVVIEANINKMPVRKMDNFLAEVQHPINKCLIVGNPEPLHELELQMAKDLKGRMEVFRSAAFFIELTPLNIDKAQTLDGLCKKLGISREEVIACGDGYNDISMIEYAGLGVAMSNSVDEVKAKANYITGSNNEDGIADVVDKFILSQD